MRNASHIAITSTLILALGLSVAFAEDTGQYMDDAAITTKVKAALLTDKQLKTTNISVETNQGTVQLSGIVSTKDAESEAVNAANKISGVKAVKDLLVVKGIQQETP